MRQRSKPARISRAGLWTFLGLHALAFAAAFLAPYDPVGQNREHPLAPPTPIHFVSETGFQLRPFVYPQIPAPNNFGRYRADSTRGFPIRFLVEAEDPNTGQTRLRLFHVPEPARLYLLGTDPLGRDQLSRWLHGLRVSLATGLLAAGIAAGLGLLLGSFAGLIGGWPDEILSRGSDLFLALPWLYLLLAVRAALPPDAPPLGMLIALVVLLGVVGWARPARLVRDVARSVAQREFTQAAITLGASHWRILRAHVLPHTLPVALLQWALLVPRFILAEATLSFLGLGIPEPAPSWGNLLTPLRQLSILASCWWMFFPALALILVVLSYHRWVNALHSSLDKSSF